MQAGTKIAVFGATGGTGRQIVEQALAQGMQVTALVRDPSKLPIQNALFKVVKGDVLDRSAVESTVSGVDAVFVSLGNTANNPDMVVSQGTAMVVTAMQAAGIRRLIVISSLGVGDSKDHIPLFFKAIIATALRKAFQDKEAQEKLVMASRLDWTIIRPSGLSDGPATGSYRSGDVKATGNTVARADVAAFALAQLQSDQYLHKTPGIAG
jgi:putative NADH-flavin reductase